jgi:lysine 2,3-aminomutase
MEYLRGRLSGLAIPSFVVDAPHGGGKIPILPNYIISTSPTHTVLRTYEGMIVNYPEPGVKNNKSESKNSSTYVWELLNGRKSSITPQNTKRQERRDIIKNHDIDNSEKF